VTGIVLITFQIPVILGIQVLVLETE